MKQSKWIWYPGDYELMHSIKLHARREEFGVDYPAMWGLANVFPRMVFYTEFEAAAAGSLKILAKGEGFVTLDGQKYPVGADIPVAAGKHRISARILRQDGLPAIYCVSELLASDESWYVTPGAELRDLHAACEPAYFSAEDDVDVFPFALTEVLPASVEGGLHDFGKELFASLEFDADPADEILVVYGESLEEATTYNEPNERDNALITERVSGKSHYCLKSRAFRYANFVGASVRNAKAWLELLPVEYKASFSCPDKPELEKIIATCAYTFHLNSREFLLDGIKRDRWCWSGDAYQSYLVNDYLFADRALNRRTITALYGKPPYYEHINTINDYSALLIIGTWEYYFTTGDLDFIRFILPRAKALYQFILDRLDENGLVVQRPGDWIFIDWSNIDKNGPLCAEQVLLWQAHNAMAWLAAAVGEDGAAYLARADALKARIMEKYWDDEKRAFIDSFTSGRRNVTRHASIFAILYDFVDRETADVLVESVLENDAITKLTTPYFEFYELMALCKLGHIEYAQNMIDSYWGGMLKLGATTIWEQYDPTQSGIEHFGMYGMRFGKSLCHAWGSGPVYLLGRYCAGVAPTAIGSATFEVAPNPGRYERFDAVVPIAGGTVSVHIDGGKLRVETALSGGIVKWKGREYPLMPGEVLVIE
ncbi:MAG: hypothetical protein IJF67_17565 [Clostridia bacterium]|nr:hypothetical protein [Clostridia bacterium]